MNLTIRRTLLLSFGLVLVVMLSTMLYIASLAQNEARIQERMVDLREPTVTSAIRLAEAVQQSLAALRGYMLLGAEPAAGQDMLSKYDIAWSSIETEREKLSVLSVDWTDQNNRTRLEAISTALTAFQTQQKNIIAIAHAPENLPALRLLETKAVPESEKVFNAITVMINAESAMAASAERKTLFKNMADFRGAFSASFADLRAYLLTNNKDYLQSYEKKAKTANVALADLTTRNLLLNTEQQQGFLDLNLALTGFTSTTPQLLLLRESADWNKANTLLKTLAAPSANNILFLLEQLEASQQLLLTQDKELLENTANKLKTTLIVGMLIALICSIAVAKRVSDSIALRLNVVKDSADIIAKGDLSRPPIGMTHANEIGNLARSIDVMQANLRGVLEKIGSSSLQLASAAEQLLLSSKASLQQIQTQQNETHSVATAMEEMAATVKDVARNAEHAALSASEADTSSNAGKAVVQDTVIKIKELATAIDLSAKTINSLGSDTASVDKIVAVISAIAEQTNLLALNAAIEAARAGEQGRGFAVVADEVRTLAARTQQSTLEIRTMLDKLKNGAMNAVDGMAQGHTLVQQSVESSDKTIASLHIITDAVAAIRAMNDQIATAAEQQSVVADEMNRSVLTISDGAASMVTQSQQSHATASSIENMANELKALTQTFKL